MINACDAVSTGARTANEEQIESCGGANRDVLTECPCGSTSGGLPIPFSRSEALLSFRLHFIVYIEVRKKINMGKRHTEVAENGNAIGHATRMDELVVLNASDIPENVRHWL